MMGCYILTLKNSNFEGGLIIDKIELERRTQALFANSTLRISREKSISLCYLQRVGKKAESYEFQDIFFV